MLLNDLRKKMSISLKNTNRENNCHYLRVYKKSLYIFILNKAKEILKGR